MTSTHGDAIDLERARAALTIVQPEPFNAEAPREALAGDVTPTELHYVRSNFALPSHDGSLEVGVTFTVGFLKPGRAGHVVVERRLDAVHVR